MTFDERRIERAAGAVARELRVPFAGNRSAMVEYARAAVSAYLGDDSVVVPKEPSDVMIDAACCCERGRTVEDALRAEYKAMLSAAARDGE